jgi:hypothetical protein
MMTRNFFTNYKSSAGNVLRIPENRFRPMAVIFLSDPEAVNLYTMTSGMLAIAAWMSVFGGAKVRFRGSGLKVDFLKRKPSGPSQ